MPFLTFREFHKVPVLVYQTQFRKSCCVRYPDNGTYSETVSFAEECPITFSISLVAQNYNDF